jgi:hypothetical protein
VKNAIKQATFTVACIAALAKSAAPHIRFAQRPALSPALWRLAPLAIEEGASVKTTVKRVATSLAPLFVLAATAAPPMKF